MEIQAFVGYHDTGQLYMAIWSPKKYYLNPSNMNETLWVWT